MLDLLGALLVFDPLLASAADAIPELVPPPLVVQTTPPSKRRLRGDFEVGPRLALVYTEAWPEVLVEISEHALASGAQLVFIREQQSRAGAYQRFLGTMQRRHPDRLSASLATVDTPWIRDWGPLQLEFGGRSLWLDSDYHDDERARDDEAPLALSRDLGASLAAFDWPLDGGAVVSNGAGLCAMTLEYLEYEGLSLDEDDLGQMLARLGCRATALVPTLVREPTKHADMIMQFVSPSRVLLTEIAGDDESASSGEDAMRMDAAAQGLLRAADSLGLGLEIVRVPTPPPDADSVYSFVNGLRLADRYLMPSYPELGEPANLRAWTELQGALELPVVVIDASELLLLGGALHCVSLSLF